MPRSLPHPSHLTPPGDKQHDARDSTPDTCGNSSATRTVNARGSALAAAIALAFTVAPAAAILFIGNSFTYGDLAPTVMNYKPSTVTDLVGTGIGGVPALFEQMTTDRGLDYTVFLETQGGSGLDFHYNNRLALINKPWDVVSMHGQSNLNFAAPGNPALSAPTPGSSVRSSRRRTPTSSSADGDLVARQPDVSARLQQRESAEPVVRRLDPADGHRRA